MGSFFWEVVLRDLVEDLVIEVLAAGVKIGTVCGFIYATAYCMVGLL